jgi:O-antigen ligase
MLPHPECVGRRRWTWLVLALLASTLSVVLTSQRVFDEGAFTTESIGAEGGAVVLIRHTVQAVAFLVVFGLACAGLRSDRWRPGTPGRGVLLLLAACPLAMLPSYVLGVEASTRNLMNLAGALLLLVAVHGLPKVDTAWLLRLIKRALLVFLYGSILAAITRPQWALQTGYDQGLSEMLPFRLHGLAFHANALAPLAALYLILLRWQPARLPLESLHVVAALAVLVLCQSKTAWLGLIVAVALSHLYSQRHPHHSRGVLALAAVLVLIPLVLLLDTAGAGPVTAATRFLDSNEELLTLTGRLAIWGATLVVWQENKWFGYGPELWGEGMQEHFLPLMGWTFGHAHSFYFQALGQGGLVGLTGATFLLAGVLRTSWRSRLHCGGVVLGVCIFVLLRTIAEPTFANRIGWSPDVILIVLVIATAARLHQRAPSRAAMRHRADRTGLPHAGAPDTHRVRRPRLTPGTAHA